MKGYTKILTTSNGVNSARTTRPRVSLEQRVAKKRAVLKSLDPWALICLDVKLSQ